MQVLATTTKHVPISSQVGPGLVTLRSATKVYETPVGPFTALDSLDLSVAPGDFLAIVGKSGSGKTTLANLMTGIDSASSGEVWAGTERLTGKSEEALTAWRGRHVGVVFQFFQLLPTLTVAENVMLPMDFCRTVPAGQRRERARQLLDKLGIASQADKLPIDLSGGQQQRAAIARALANDSPLIVADEPTGNLDTRTGIEVMELFKALTREGKAVVMVTHERDLAHYFTRTVTLEDGRLVADSSKEGRS